MPRIIRLSDAPLEPILADASRRLREGEVVVFPTETVYGLGADSYNVRALEKVYALKGRPSDNPLIAHVAEATIAGKLVKRWDERCERLAERFWPGSLTLVLEKEDAVPDEATAGRETIAVRCPNHPIAQQLLQVFGGAISAPSANRSGHVSPTRARHVGEDFSDVEDLIILDGGPCAVGIESTVLDLTCEPARILRPGGVTADDLELVLGKVMTQAVEYQVASPGTAPAHYAPRTRAELVEAADLPGRLAALTEPAVVLSRGENDVNAPHRSIEMPDLAEDYGMRLYDALREADALDYSIILIEKPEKQDGLWGAIQDRLFRATCRG